jgi:hypothetical protein
MPRGMVVIASDILADLCGLSLGLIIALLPIGLMLWLFGWWSHRFWIVLMTTVLAGIFGLVEATSWHAQPIIVAVLLAIAAGVLALALVRVVTFAIGGLAGVYLVQFAFPTLNQQAICFLLSGLLCLLLFRWFFMMLTSFMGAACLAYGSLALLNYQESLDAVCWCDENTMLLNITCGGAMLAGFTWQLLFDRWRTRRLREREEEDSDGDLLSNILARIGFGRKSEDA